MHRPSTAARRGVLDTVRRLGRLQLDPISTVAPPQRLVLWSRLGSAFDPGELERLLWEERQLFEWNAFIWPIEALPMIRARMARPNRGKYAWERRSRDFLAANREVPPPRAEGARGERPAALARAGRPLGRRLGVGRLVGQPQRGGDARDPARARRGRDRRPPLEPPALGPRGALVSGDRGALARRGGARARGAALPDARRPPDEGGRVGGTPGRPRTGRCPIASRCSRRSTG